MLLMALTHTLAAAPFRAPPRKPTRTVWEEGRSREVVIVKLAEDGPSALPGVSLTPLFERSPDALRQDRATWDPEHRLADLTRYYRIAAPPGEAEALCDRLNARDDVEIAYLAFEPAPPPLDISPETPDFTGEQGYLGPAPDGFGVDAAADWPGGDGANVAVADIEYSWDPEHEDLQNTQGIRTWGWDSGDYSYHGNGVLSILLAGDNGYGVTGFAPAAEPVVISPYLEPTFYSIAAAIDGAAAMLETGDVLLIEQQVIAGGSYAPVSAESATFDAISLAVARGIVVVEPAANGGQNLDAASWDGWFDRTVRDSGSIMVGGGASPLSGRTPRSYYSGGGSCYGSRVDVQGWYDHIVSATSSEYSPDLYYPDGDSRQAYTSTFGGTSGASPMVAGAAAVVQSVAIAVHGEPFDPFDLRALMVSTGTPQPEGDPYHVGPQPDVRRMLRVGLLP